MSASKMSAAEVVSAVRRHYGAERDSRSPEWAALAELGDGPGYSVRRRADLFLVRAWSGQPKGHERILVEVKVTRADLRHELATPQKLARIGQHAHRVYFATPVGLVKPDEDLGEGVGLLEVTGQGAVRTSRRASRREPDSPPPEGMFVEAFRRAARAEARLRAGADETDPAATIAALRTRLSATEASLQRAKETVADERSRNRTWEHLIASSGAIPCVCGAAMATPRSHRSWERSHADRSIPCASRYGPEPDLEVLRDRFSLALAPAA